jgi:hypothetical protein
MTEPNPTPAPLDSTEPPGTPARRAIPQPMPEHFVAWGRLFGGLAVSIFGALGLHLINNKDANAFAIVASVAGLVLSGWGFAATNLSPKARREDVLWAWLLFGLLLATLSGNAYYNRRDYGLAFIGIELIACGIAAAVALVAYLLAGFFFKLGSRSEHERRGWRMVSMMACGLVFWPLLRWPLLALALGGAIGPGEQNSEDVIVAKGMRRDMPAWLLRWAVHQALQSAQAERRGRAVTASAAGELLDSSELTALVLDDKDQFVRIEALRTLANQDGKSAAAAIMESVKRGTVVRNFFFPQMLRLLSSEQLNTLLDSQYCKGAIIMAYNYSLGSLLLAAVKKFGMNELIRKYFDRTSSSVMSGDEITVALMILADTGPQEQAELFNYWKPNAHDIEFDGVNIFWLKFDRGAKQVYALALKSSDTRVLNATYKSLLNTLSNSDAVRAALETEQASPDERIRAACKKLLDSLERSGKK